MKKVILLSILFFFYSPITFSGCSEYQNSQPAYGGKFGKITSILISADKAEVNYIFQGSVVHKTTISVDEVGKYPIGMRVYFIPWDREDNLQTGKPISYWLMSKEGECPLIGREKVSAFQIEEATK